jgi:hypothetical protein
MKIAGTTIINILFSLLAICALELASASGEIPHVPPKKNGILPLSLILRRILKQASFIKR